MPGRAGMARGRARAQRGIEVLDLRGAGRRWFERAFDARAVQRPRELGEKADRRRLPRNLFEDLAFLIAGGAGLQHPSLLISGSSPIPSPSWRGDWGG